MRQSETGGREHSSGRVDLILDSAESFPDPVDVRPLEAGGFAVLERASPRVAVLDAQGSRPRWSPAARLGRALSTVVDDGLGRLMVPDIRNRRVDVYDLNTLSVAGEFPLNDDEGLPTSWRGDHRGRLFCLVADATDSPWGLGADGIGEGTVQIRILESGVLRHHTKIPGAPGRGMIYGPRLGWCVCCDGSVAAANGVDHRLAYYQGDRLIRTVVAPGSGPALTPSDKDIIRSVVAAEGQRLADDLSPIVARLFSSEPVAEMYPAFLEILGDDLDRIWFRSPTRASELRGMSPRVAFHAVDDGSSHWTIQGADGSYRWNVSFPVGFHLTAVRADRAVGFLRTEGGARVQVYRVEAPGS